MWNLLKKILLESQSQPDHNTPGPITETLLSACEILTAPPSDLQQDFAMGHGLLFQAQIIEELARRVTALERQST